MRKVRKRFYWYRGDDARKIKQRFKKWIVKYGYNLNNITDLIVETAEGGGHWIIYCHVSCECQMEVDREKIETYWKKDAGLKHELLVL